MAPKNVVVQFSNEKQISLDLRVYKSNKNSSVLIYIKENT